MASGADEAIGPDQHPGAPHPREQSLLFGHQEAETAFLEAWRGGRLHHAWLVGGPAGIGKATFAWRATRFLLANPDPSASGAAEASSLYVAPDARVFRQVASGAHPDIAVIRRGPRKDGKGFSAEIAVADVRRALDLFAATASGWRVVIVDCADDLNAAGANALLKAIEEPPPRAIVFVISHAPARTLPTIRSRCRRLNLRPLADADVTRAVRSLGAPWSDAEEAELAEAVALAHGSVGEALAMLDETRRALIRQTRGLLDALPRMDVSQALALADKVTGRDQEEAFRTVLETVGDWASAVVRSQAGLGPRRLAPLVEVWEKNAQAAREAESYNLDRRPLVMSMFGDLAEAVRRLSG
ncbi:DNA polymerase III subunit delta' [Camelimonas fluminis]|uniref:DNA polymerase III subunit delta n=1 Tax=Camelimonas fluminis TaxID=1576911 RepID=A0ABV7UJA2_9HYPH|nr:DNA polymerase III subunit delta' [Camelimonas fluminis]GHE58069.1 DNA polymerase III subunit delta' [Camelimonas fluminis]